MILLVHERTRHTINSPVLHCNVLYCTIAAEHHHRVSTRVGRDELVSPHRSHFRLSTRLCRNESFLSFLDALKNERLFPQSQNPWKDYLCRQGLLASSIRFLAWLTLYLPATKLQYIRGFHWFISPTIFESEPE